jgi:flagellar hook assembly protein FlgD
VVKTNSEEEKSIMIGVDKKPFITHASITPNPFSPNNVDGQDDTTTVSYDVSEDAYVSVEVYQQDTLVKTLLDNPLLTMGHHSHIWDGKDEQGEGCIAGRYTMKITAHAETGNIGDPVFVDVSLLNISNIHISSDKINPYLDQTTTIFYKVGSEAILTIKIYDSENSLVKTLILNESHLQGEYSQAWDGKDNNGGILPDGLYYFVIEDSISGAPYVVYDPRGTGGKDISKSIGLSGTSFNTPLNQFCTLTYTLPQAANINMKVRYGRYSGPAVKTIKFLEPTAKGQHQTLWDGRDEAGNFVNYAIFTFAAWGYTLDDNSILIVGSAPVITDPVVSPIRFTPYVNPYSSNGSAETTISFDLSRDANVMINIYNSSGDLVRTLLDDVFCSQGENSLIWDGKDDEDRSVAGDFYRVIIQAHYGDSYSESMTLHAQALY